MAVHASWYNTEKTILYFRFSYPWTVEQFLDLNAVFGGEICTLPHTVDAIFDFTSAGTISAEDVSGFRRAAKSSVGAPNQGISVMYGNPMLSLVVKVVRLVVPTTENRVFVVDNEQEAVELIRRMRSASAA
ncbi:MAG: hypothetical protein AAF787_00930 [Chloroflexota bacterium]